ncbi:MAG: EAL domain-containing protein [Gammaproteobacteria bacterium]|nr:EAL domain-containing protein [Gammaproteobacteria bacterium]
MVALAKHLVSGHKISLQQREHFKATRDSWTGLLNQITFDERVEQEIKLSARYGKKFALLVVDLNHFGGNFSDSCSKLENKNTLIEFSVRLKSCVRCTDVLARNDNDFFLILLPDIQSHRHVVNVVDNIYNSLSTPIVIKNKEYFLHPAIGIGIYPTDSERGEGLIQCAFEAKGGFSEKPSSRHYRFYADKVNDSVELQLLNEKTIRKVIEQGEYDVFFEPISRMGTQEVAFYDAVTTWRSSLLVDDCQGEIISTIDKMALSPLFNEMMLVKICRQLRQWQNQPLLAFTPVLMQVTPSQFENTRLACQLHQVADNEAVETRHIGVIIKESTILYDVGKAIRQIRRLKKEGFLIMIDEFSQGFSYIGLLKKELVDLIRIAPLLVEQVDVHIECLSVIEGIVRVAANLQIETIIPNIDSCYQYKTFLNIHGNYWQGEFTQASIGCEDFAAM